MDELIRQREIVFDAMHPDPNQAQSAMLLLADIEGIEALHHLAPLRMSIRYNLTRLTLAHIETRLIDEGFHLDGSLMSKLKRALYAYTEETLRANLGCANENSTRDVFVKQYHKKPHGCRDPRPPHWRNYL